MGEEVVWVRRRYGLGGGVGEEVEWVRRCYG